METNEMRQKRIDNNKFKRTICKNAEWSLDTKGEELINSGCKNPRENGSNRCKKCSDDYKENK